MEQSIDVREQLIHQDDDFRRWAEEHHRYEDRLAELARKPVLSADEEVEEKQLKKRKLLLKDQMAAKIRGWEAAHPV
jgi:uncharacterized protein YdcH (DUF465 family)